jgi:copper(I)-binding protein
MKKLLPLLGLALSALTAHAQTLTAQDPWVRATVAQQKATGAFMQLQSPAGARLVEVRSPVAERVEIHEMRMEGAVMKMREMPALELPAGQTVELKPGSYHLMLMGLKRALQAGEEVPLTLIVEAKGGKRETLELKAPARAMTPPAAHGAHQH